MKEVYPTSDARMLHSKILPQTSKKFTQINLPHLWHFATLLWAKWPVTHLTFIQSMTFEAKLMFWWRLPLQRIATTMTTFLFWWPTGVRVKYVRKDLSPVERFKDNVSTAFEIYCIYYGHALSVDVFSCPDESLRQLYTYPCHWLSTRHFTFWH